MVKLNDRFEFPDELDLTELLHEPFKKARCHCRDFGLFPNARSDETEQEEEKELPGRDDPPPQYLLHSVLVHSGNLQGGHYYAFVRPLGESPECSTKEAVSVRATCLLCFIWLWPAADRDHGREAR